MDEEVREKLSRKHKCRFTKRLRRRMTPEETLLWKVLRNRRCRGYKFRRQVNIGPFIADFLCKEHRLIVEVDGSIHNKKEHREHDRFRDSFLQECGYRVLRITNDEAHKSLPDVLDHITKTLHSKTNNTTNKNNSPLLHEERGRG